MAKRDVMWIQVRDDNEELIIRKSIRRTSNVCDIVSAVAERLPDLDKGEIWVVCVNTIDAAFYLRRNDQPISIDTRPFSFAFTTSRINGIKCDIEIREERSGFYTVSVKTVRATMQVFVRLYSSRMILLTMNSADTVATLKNIIRDKEGLPPDWVPRLHHHRNRLDDDQTITLTDSGIRDLTTISVVGMRRVNNEI